MNQNQGTQGLVMVAPVAQSEFERKDKKDIVKIEIGNHLGRLYGIVDHGTQLNTMYNKKSQKIVLLFEFPHLMQSFYKNNEEQKPSMIKCEFTYSMHPKASLRKFLETGLGKKMTDEEAKNFNIFSILNQWFTCSIGHDEDKKDAQNVYERISFIQPYDQRFKVEGVNYNGINKQMAYSISIHGFAGEAWQSLWSNMRNKIQQSDEGQAFSNQGGRFEEVKYNDDNNAQANSYSGPAGPANNGGGMQQQQASPVGAQPQGQPQGAPNQPVNTPQGAPAPQQMVKKFVIKTPPYDMAAWTAKNWTEETMIAQGHGEYIESPV